MMVDTGANLSLIHPATVDRLRLHQRAARELTLNGPGPSSVPTPTATPLDLHFGPQTAPHELRAVDTGLHEPCRV
jgi:hypothetical protein